MPGLAPKLNFRPSAAHRWISCPGEPFVRAYAPKSDTPYTLGGTIGHGHLSSQLTGRPVTDYVSEDALKRGEELEVLPTEEEITLLEEMAQLVRDLADLYGGEIFVEQPVTVHLDNGDIDGTADVVIVSPSDLIVLDLKWGAGRKVHVERNPQLSLYALGAYERWPRRHIEMGVIQPRGVGDGLTTWEPPAAYLSDFHKSVNAALLRASSGELPPFNAGPWCKEYGKCPGLALGLCPEVLVQSLLFAAGLREHDPGAEPAWWMLDYADTALDLANGITEEAMTRLKAGELVPGWRLGTETGKRKWRNPKEIAQVLADMTGTDIENWQKTKTTTTTTPIGITEASRHAVLKPMIKKIETVHMDRTTKQVLVKDTNGEDPWFVEED